MKFMMTRRKIILYSIVAAGMVLGLLWKTRFVPSSESALGVTVEPYQVRIRRVSGKIAFDRPLYVGEGIAVKFGTNTALLELVAVMPTEIEVKIRCDLGFVATQRFSEEIATFCGTRLRWSVQDRMSIWIYQDPLLNAASYVSYSVAYPVSLSQFVYGSNSISNLSWLTNAAETIGDMNGAGQR
jgi:hypothetical protein